MDCPELKAAAEDFFELHFTEVYKLDEFLQLNVSQLTHLLHHDKLTVRAEAQVHTHTHTFIDPMLYFSFAIFLKNVVKKKMSGEFNSIS